MPQFRVSVRVHCMLAPAAAACAWVRVMDVCMGRKVHWGGTASVKVKLAVGCSCAFGNCAHLAEPGCAVREGWARHAWCADSAATRSRASVLRCSELMLPAPHGCALAGLLQRRPARVQAVGVLGQGAASPSSVIACAAAPSQTVGLFSFWDVATWHCALQAELPQCTLFN